MGLLLLLLLLSIALSLPIVQTKIGTYLTETINRDYGSDLKVDQVSISLFGGVKLKKVLIKDYKKDTMIYVNRIKTNILSFKKLYEGDLLFGEVRLDGVLFKMKTYKNETEFNLDKFIALFDDGKPSTKKFILNAKNVYVTNSTFILWDENVANPLDLKVQNLNAELTNFKILGSDVKMNIQKLSATDHRGLKIKNLVTSFTYTKKFILMENLAFETPYSNLKGSVVMNYDRKDFADFYNKVQFDVKIDKSSISTNDLNCFYKQFGKNKLYKLRTSAYGTLNNFNLRNLKLKDKAQSEIIGTVNFKNLFNDWEKNFYMKGRFEKISSDYQQLTQLLPNILGKYLPKSLMKLGTFNYRGSAEVTTTSIVSDFYASTKLGNIQSNLSISNIDFIDNATYEGNVILEKFNIGAFMGYTDFKDLSLNVDIKGKGFSYDFLDTNVIGDVYKLNYKGYNYTNITVDGNLKKPIFTGNLQIKDPNLKLDFNGIADLQKSITQYDFETNIVHANLYKLNWIKSDSIAVFKGNLKMNVSGTNIEDLNGTLNLTNTSYQNKKNTYVFDDFTLSSSFDDKRVRTITIDSPDIIEGSIVGKFQFSQLQKILENALGSLYANYSPNIVKKGQFVNFNFSIYNKIVEIFYPGIVVGKETIMNGKMNADENDFKFNFSSPQIAAYENYFDNIKIQIDNKNPLFNAYFEMDSIKTKYYKIADFSLMNVTTNDTLYVRSEFKGGNKLNDDYKFNLYHTIDKENNNVVGLQKSDLYFNNNLWFFNEKEDAKNRIVFDKRLKNFKIEDIVLSHENEKLTLNGLFKGDNYKDVNLSFENVDLKKVTPNIDALKLKGSLNGMVNFKQKNKIFQPTADLVVDNLNVNAVDLGKFKMNIIGDQDLKKFYINSNVENKAVESFSANGDFSFINDKTNIDLDVRFNRFNIGSLSLLGEDVITDIKGFASGSATISGLVTDPQINGRLYLEESGLTIPYMNVSYELEKNAVVDVTEKQFIFRDITVSDPKYKTMGTLFGSVRHHNFSNWDLDLNVTSDRLLALDTQDGEDVAYYGLAFINGTASVKGHTNGLIIDVNAKSEKGTSIKIPINNSEDDEANSYLHFKTPKEKYDIGKGKVEKVNDYNGLELQFDFDIDQNAEIEVILDRTSGHGMKGRGRGGLIFKINTLGKFNMWGDFVVYEGSYNFKYGGLFDKKFNVKKLGSIVWDGDPMKAILNLEAVYKTAANPSVLIENPSFNKKVPVEVVIGLKGNLSNPEPDFSINFPTVNSVLRSELQYKLDDKDMRQTQALYLLSSGSFLSPDGANNTGFASSIFETASGLFSSVIGNKDNAFNVDLDYVTADKRPGFETNARVGVTISSKINERIMINGKVGVPVGGVNESAIVGNVEIQYRVNEDGTLNLKMFNKENDVNYIGQGVGYTQGLGVNYSVDFDTFSELVNLIFKKKKIEKANPTTTNTTTPDSEPEPEQPEDSEKKNKMEEPSNREGIPTED